jgi:hypothetical protein
MLPIVVALALLLFCLVALLSSRRDILKAKSNLSSLSFPQKIDGTEDTEEDIEIELAPSIAAKRPQRIFELPYEEQKGSWIENRWVPPNGWRYFSSEELRSVYKDKSIMWVGDSLARRAALTMYGILKASDVDVSVAAIDDPDLINVNKQSISQPCRKWTGSCREGGKRYDCPHQPRWCKTMPGGVGDYVYVNRNKFSDIGVFFSNELSGKYNITEDFDTIIIAMGNHGKKSKAAFLMGV